MPHLDTPRGRFFYRERVGDAPVLLFLHGNLATSRWWEPVLRRLPEGWRGIAFDALGYGGSDRTDELTRFSVPARLRDLIAVVQALNLERLHLIAHSTATPVAVEYALLAPETVTTLTLIGPVPFNDAQTPTEAYPLLEQLPTDRAMIQRAIRASAPHLDEKEMDMATLVGDVTALDPLALPAIARGLDAWTPGERPHNLTMPVMVVRGEDDIMLEEQEAHRILLAIPGAGQLELLHGAGHSPMIETPSGLTELLVTFIAEDWDEYESIRQSVE